MLGHEAIHPHRSGLRERFEDATGSPVDSSCLLRMDPQIAEPCGSPTRVGAA